MHYISDVIVNWQDNGVLYDFYEWHVNDNIEVLNYVPVVRISKSSYKKIVNNDVKLDLNFINEIKSNKLFNFEFNYCIITNMIQAIAIAINDEGVIVNKSKLFLDIESEILNMDLKLHNIDLLINKKYYEDSEVGLTRREREIKNYIKERLMLIKKSGDTNKIRYFYYEWFEDFSYDIQYMYQKLNNALNNGWSQKHEQIYELIKLSELKSQQNS